MKSILEGREELKAVVYQIAEVTGYLWQKGWSLSIWMMLAKP